MSSFRLILRSLCYYWRTNLAVACGVAAGTAVLSGALLVGDSMRGSLRRLVLDRLGRIDAAMVTGRFFRAELAEELAAVPAILLRVSLENADPQSPRRANRVELMGCDARFWQLGDGRPQNLPQPGEIVLNQPAAERLGAGVGQSVLLRLPNAGPIPADSAPGQKTANRPHRAAGAERDYSRQRFGAIRAVAHATGSALRLCPPGLAWAAAGATQRGQRHPGRGRQRRC